MEKYLVTKEEIEQSEGLAKTHFLNDNAKRINKSLGDLTGLTGGHESTEFHKHYHEDECVYMLEGEAEAQIGDEKFTVKAGDFIGYRAAGEAHTLRNTSNAAFKCIVVGQRLDHDVGDYPNLNKRIYRQRGLPWDLVDIDKIEKPSSVKEAGKKA